MSLHQTVSSCRPSHAHNSCAFERDVPFYLRCRTAALATTSVYYEPVMAVRDTPELNKRDLRRTFEVRRIAQYLRHSKG